VDTLRKLFDTFSLVHFAFWFVVGADMVWLKVPFWYGVAGVVVGAYVWEVVESVLERKNLVSGNENPLNRWASDPIVGLIGAGVGAMAVAI